jgi:uncharacterized protein (TIGR02147 family)
METVFYRHRLQEELSRRCERNPRYSVRAYAKSLNLSPGALSQILSGKRLPSYKLAQRILSYLEFTPEEETQFLTSLARSQQAFGAKRLAKHVPEQRLVVRELTADLFRVIGDWYHYAILELTFVEGFRPEPYWIAKQLGITPTETKLAIDRLLQLELLKREGGTLKKAPDHVTTADKQITAPALRRHQKQLLEKAIASLENDPIEIRNMSSVTLAIDPELIPEARAKIFKLTQTLCKSLDRGKYKKVYALSVSLFPLQKGDPS